MGLVLSYFLSPHFFYLYSRSFVFDIPHFSTLAAGGGSGGGGGGGGGGDSGDGSGSGSGGQLL